MDQDRADPAASHQTSSQQTSPDASQQAPSFSSATTQDYTPQRQSSSEPRNKRKRGDSTASDEPNRHRAKFTQPEPRRPFNILAGLCQHGDLLHYITTRLLHPRDLLLLYRTCRPFFYLVNKNMTKYVMASATAWVRLMCDAPPGIHDIRYLDEIETASGEKRELRPSDDMLFRIFPFHIYAHLCVVRSRNPGNVAYVAPPGAVTVGLPQPGTTRRFNYIPSLRYLFFILTRVNAIHSILRTLLYGHHFRLPESMPITLAKIWFLMDLPTNGGRIALIHNRRFFRDGDIRRAVLFFLKLDMVFSDPVEGDANAAKSMRELLLSQRGLFILDRVLKRTQAQNQMELMKIYVRWKFPSDIVLNRTGGKVFEVPEHECGNLYWEGWGQNWVPIQGGTAWVLVPGPAGPGPGPGPAGGGVGPGGPPAAQPQGPGPNVGVGGGGPPAQGLALNPNPAPPAQHANIGAQPPAAPQVPQQINPAQPTIFGPFANPAPPAQPQQVAQAPPPPANPQPVQQQQPQPQQPHPPVGVHPQAPPLPLGPAPRRLPLIRPDQLAVREGVRRRLGLNQEFRDMMMSGYINPDNLQNWPVVHVMGESDEIWQEELRKKQEKEKRTKERAEKVDQMAKLMKGLFYSSTAAEEEEQYDGDEGGLEGESNSGSDGDADDDDEDDGGADDTVGACSEGHVA